MLTGHRPYASSIALAMLAQFVNPRMPCTTSTTPMKRNSTVITVAWFSISHTFQRLSVTSARSPRAKQSATGVATLAVAVAMKTASVAADSVDAYKAEEKQALEEYACKCQVA